MNKCMFSQPGLDDQQLSRLLEGDLALGNDKKAENGSDWLVLYAFVLYDIVFFLLVV